MKERFKPLSFTTIVDKKDLEQILILIEDNLHTSASRVGLEARGENLRKIERELLYMLHLTKKEAEDLYWKYQEKRG